MDTEQVVFRLVADATQYFGTIAAIESRLVTFAAAAGGVMARHVAHLSSEFERLAISLEVLAGSAATGQKLLQDIVNLSLDVPFHSSELVKVTKELRSFGFATNELVPTLAALGEVSAGTGTSMGRIALAFGQVRVAGHLTGQELRQFVNAGVPLLENLSAVMGKPVHQMQSLVHEGRVGFNDVVAAFNRMTGAGGLYHGLMERINKETVAGRWENFTENVQVLARNFGLAAFEGLKVKDVLTSMSGVVQGWTGAGKEGAGYDEQVKKLAGVFAIARESMYNLYVKGRDWVMGANSSLREFVETHKGWVQALAGILVTLATVGAVLKVISISLAVIRGVLVSIAAISGIVSLFATFQAFGASLAFLVGPAGLLTAFLASLVAIAALAGTFDGFGSSLARGWDSFKGSGLEAVNSIVDAIKSGDIESAMAVVFKAINLGWKTLIVSMKAELLAIQSNAGGAVIQAGGGADILAIETRRAVVRGFLPPGQHDAYNAETRRMVAEAVANNERLRQERPASLQKQIDDLYAGLTPDRQALENDIVNQRFLSGFSPAARSAVKAYGGQYQVSPDGSLRFMGGGAAGYYGQFPMPQAVPSALSAITGGIGPVDIGNRRNELLGSIGYLSAQARAEYARTGTTTGETYQNLVKSANAAAEELAKLDKTLGTVAQTTRDAMKTMFAVSPEAIQLSSKFIEKEAKGLTPFQTFQREVAAYGSAAQGGVTQAMGAVIGTPLMGASPPILSQEQYKKALMESYQKLVAAQPNVNAANVNNLAYRGSVEAQKAINDSLRPREGEDVQTMILNLMKDEAAKSVYNLRLQEEIRDAVKSIDGKPAPRKADIMEE